MRILSGNLEWKFALEDSKEFILQKWMDVSRGTGLELISEIPEEITYFKLNLLNNTYGLSVNNDEMHFEIQMPSGTSIVMSITLIETVYLLKDTASQLSRKMYALQDNCWEQLEAFVKFIDKLTLEVFQYLDPSLFQGWMEQLQKLLFAIQKKDSVLIADQLRYRMITPFLD